MTYSPEQRAFFNWIIAGKGSGSIVAVAGSGKTTSLVEGAQYVEGDAVFLAFNRSIADELGARLPMSMASSTFHQMCLRSLPRPRIEKGKLNFIAKRLRNAYPLLSDDDFGVAKKIVGLAKSDAVRHDVGYMTLKPYVAQHDLTIENETSTLKLAAEIISLSWDDEQTVDFDDMIWFVALGRGNVRRWDWIFVDEVQDTNKCQREVLKRCLKPNTRVVGVGDPYQAIYGFRGADAAAFASFEQEFGCERMMLSVSFRCPQAVVKAAQHVVPHIQYADTAPEGSVTSLNNWQCADLDQKGAVVCRNTAPLLKLAYKCISQRVRVRVLGSDIGEGLIAVIKQSKAKNIAELTAYLDKQLNTEVPALIAAEKDGKAELLVDRVESLFAVIDGVGHTSTLDEVVNSIRELFTDDNHRLTLSTIHKAKGREWHTVYILNAELMPSKWARQAWQQDQERNLEYVAITRAKSDLVYIHIG
jgi:superfamily I DNA/RNA helicase